MKRMILAIFTLTVLGASADYYQSASTLLQAYVGTPGGVSTSYIGWAGTTKNSTATPSTTEAVWKIRKTVYDSTGEFTEMKHARPSSGKLYGNVWTNRVNATYR